MSNTVPTQGGLIIVGVDDGPDQDYLVRFAARQAALRRSSLQIAHAMQLAPPGGAPAESKESGLAPEAGASLVRRYEELVRSDFPEVTVAGELAFGGAAPLLIERSVNTEMIVIGHRGSGGFPRLPLGSVSWQVATHAECPVFVIRPAVTTGEPHENRIVVGVDMDDASLEALDFAYVEADLRGARLELLHGAYSPGMAPTGPIGMVPPDFGVMDDGAREFLDKEIAQRRDRYPAVHADLRIEHTRPAALLVEASRSASLLVVGSRRRTGLRRLLLGSVSAEVLHTAECPVAVVPAPAHGE